MDNKKPDFIILAQLALTLSVAIISWNSTMMLTTIIITALIALRKTALKKINIIEYIGVYLALEIGLVICRIQEIFAPIIVNLLHRDLTFTGRTILWDSYLRQFSNGNAVNKLLGNFGSTTNALNSHNMGVGLLAFHGLSGLALYITATYLSAKSLFAKRKTDIAKVLSIIIFGFLINSLTTEFYIQSLPALYFGFNIITLNKVRKKH